MHIRGPRGFDAAQPAGPEGEGDAAVEAEAQAAAEVNRTPKMRAKIAVTDIDLGGAEKTRGRGRAGAGSGGGQGGGTTRADGKTEPPQPPNDKWRLLPKDEQVDVEELPLPKEVSGGRFERVRGPLFTEGIEAFDVVQNTVGDCYFVAALAAVAATHPEIIRDMVKSNGDGTYDVTFHDPDTGALLEPIRVDARLPFGKDDETGEDGIVGASVKRLGQAQNELWPAIIEKAYATLRGGYKRIGKGGNADETLPVLTGKPSPLYYLASFEKKGRTDLVWKRLTEATEHRWPMCASTPVGETEEELDEETGIVAGHVYTVLGAVERDGEKYVKLRNPHAQTEPEGDGVDDGTFEITFEQFLESYEDLCVSKIG